MNRGDAGWLRGGHLPISRASGHENAKNCCFAPRFEDLGIILLSPDTLRIGECLLVGVVGGGCRGGCCWLEGG